MDNYLNVYLFGFFQEGDELGVLEEEGGGVIIHLPDAGEGPDRVLEHMDLVTKEFPIGGKFGGFDVKVEGETSRQSDGRLAVDSGERISASEGSFAHQAHGSLEDENGFEVAFQVEGQAGRVPSTPHIRLQ